MSKLELTHLEITGSSALPNSVSVLEKHSTGQEIFVSIIIRIVEFRNLGSRSRGWGRPGRCDSVSGGSEFPKLTDLVIFKFEILMIFIRIFEIIDIFSIIMEVENPSEFDDIA